MNDDVIFRYKNGKIIPIRINKDVTTNEYMNKKIKNSIKKDEESYGYHYGDLGKGRDTYFFNIDVANRSTGHFGTGTYFFGEEGNKNDPLATGGDRSVQKVNFNDYHLFKPKNETDAFLLHRGLRAVNYLRELDNDSFETMRDMFGRYGISSKDISNAYYKVRDTYYSPKYQNANYDARLDSMSTLFMKELGFNGVDVRNIKGYDNSSYGSVIYDLNKKKNEGGKK